MGATGSPCITRRLSSRSAVARIRNVVATATLETTFMRARTCATARCSIMGLPKSHTVPGTGLYLKTGAPHQATGGDGIVQPRGIQHDAYQVFKPGIQRANGFGQCSSEVHFRRGHGACAEFVFQAANIKIIHLAIYRAWHEKQTKPLGSRWCRRNSSGVAGFHHDWN